MDLSSWTKYICIVYITNFFIFSIWVVLLRIIKIKFIFRQNFCFKNPYFIILITYVSRTLYVIIIKFTLRNTQVCCSYKYLVGHPHPSPPVRNGNLSRRCRCQYFLQLCPTAHYGRLYLGLAYEYIKGQLKCECTKSTDAYRFSGFHNLTRYFFICTKSLLQRTIQI